MLKERLFFLKRDSLLFLFITVLMLLSLPYGFSLNIFYCIFFIFFITQFLGFWRLDIGYMGKFFAVASITIFLLISFVQGVILKPQTPAELGTYIGIDHPFNYIILVLYFGTLIWIVSYSLITDRKKKSTTTELLSRWDVDYKAGVAFLASNLNGKQNKSIKIHPKKHTLSIWLTVITQVFLIKMSWNSTPAGIFFMVCISLVAPIALLFSLGLLGAAFEVIKIEKINSITLKPALRMPFNLKSFIQQSQKNSY